MHISHTEKQTFEQFFDAGAILAVAAYVGVYLQHT